MANPMDDEFDPLAAANPQEDEEFDLDLPEGGFIVPDGPYVATLVNLQRQTSNNGNPMIVWDFRIDKGEYAGREFKNFTALTPQAAWKVTEVCEALGLGTPGGKATFKKSDAIGRKAVIVMAKTEYNGTERSSIQRVVATEDRTTAAQPLG